MSLLRVFVCLAVLCIVPSLSQTKLRFPSQLEINVALNNPDTVDKALRCIEGTVCTLPYGRLLRRAGPELISRGRCPHRMCTREQETQARKLIVQIQQRYPKRFYRTVNTIANKRVTFG